MFYPKRLKGLWHFRGRGHDSFHSFISFLIDKAIPLVSIPHGIAVEEDCVCYIPSRAGEPHLNSGKHPVVNKVFLSDDRQRHH